MKRHWIPVLLVMLTAFGWCTWQAQANQFVPATSNSARVVVHFENGATLIQRVDFPESSITGLEALRRTGLTVGTLNDSLVCNIAGQGCPVTDCFCRCKGKDCQFWGYWHWTDSRWVPSNVGPAQAHVSDGAIDGWRWSDFTTPPQSVYLVVGDRALTWLRAHQQPDGSFYGSEVGLTVDAVLAGAAAGARPENWHVPGGKSPLDYLSAQANAYANRSPAAAGKLAVAVTAAGGDPTAFGGVDLLEQIRHSYQPATGQYGFNNWDQAWSILALRGVSESVPLTATRRLKSTQRDDGGWGFAPDIPTDVDSTALVLEALVSAGEPITSTAIVRALNFLHNQQLPGAGFPGYSGAVSANSIAYAVQGLIASGQNPLSNAWKKDHQTPLDALIALQSADGSFAGIIPNDLPATLQATAQAIPALFGRTFPLRGRTVAVRQALAWMRTHQNVDGGFPGFTAQISDLGATLDAMFAIAAAGQNPDTWRPEGISPLDFTATRVASYTTRTDTTAKLLLAVVAAERDPSSFAGTDLIARVTGSYTATGQYGHNLSDHVWSLLALDAVHRPIPRPALEWLKAQQQPDGGWDMGFGTDTNTTALALQALTVAGEPVNATTVLSATHYLHRQQNNDGGFPYTKPSVFGTDTDANSTAYVVQGLLAIQQDPISPAWMTTLTATEAITLTQYDPETRLLAFQNTTGAFRFQANAPADSPLATYQAVSALLERPLPVKRQTLRTYLPLVTR